MARPLMPPDALHQAAKAWACCTNSISSPGSMVLAASLKTAMWIVFGPTPRTDEAPPGPGSQILPTSGQTPLSERPDVAAELLADVGGADVVADECEQAT